MPEFPLELFSVQTEMVPSHFLVFYCLLHFAPSPLRFPISSKLIRKETAEGGGGGGVGGGSGIRYSRSLSGDGNENAC